VIDLESALKTLIENKVEFVIIGGFAVSAYGSAYITNDLDFCYRRSENNFANIVSALTPYHPRLRGAPEDLLFLFDVETLRRGNNFTLKTDLGDIDMFGEIAGVSTYEDVEQGALIMGLMDMEVKVISLEMLIKSKRAAGRTKDLLVLPELETLLELKNESDI
jgi:predicted nucleotidyltransferase